MIILHKCIKWKLNDIWFLRYEMWQTKFFVILPHQQLKKSKFWKNEKMPEDIIILHKYKKNHDHMLYILFLGYSMRWMQLLFLILGYFCPFTPLTAQKIKT